MTGINDYKLRKSLCNMAKFRRHIARVKGLGFIFWHARHELYHVLLGVAWGWVLRETWGEFNVRWLTLSLFGSLLPDVEHFIYFFTYGRKDPYNATIRQFLKNGEWRMVTVYMEHGHKYNIDLSYHNFFVIAFLLLLATVAFLFDRNSWVVFFGAMVIHYVFDVLDDIVTLGYINPNWKRWGKRKKETVRREDEQRGRR
jgi:hypothetical protein